MSTENQIVNFLDFNFEGQDIRIVDKEGNPYFVAKDVCAILEIKNVSDACKDLDEDEKYGIALNDSMGRSQKTLIISESGVYDLINRSRKPEARKFSKWVRKEVLPQIRKTGGYSPETSRQLSELEMIHKMSGHMLDQERRLKALENDINKIKNKQKESEDKLNTLPEPSVECEKSTRALINQRIRAFCANTGSEFPVVWRKIYTEFYYMYGINVKLRSKNRNMKKLDYLESIDKLDDLYAVVCHICDV